MTTAQEDEIRVDARRAVAARDAAPAPLRAVFAREFARLRTSAGLPEEPDYASLSPCARYVARREALELSALRAAYVPLSPLPEEWRSYFRGVERGAVPEDAFKRFLEALGCEVVAESLRDVAGPDDAGTEARLADAFGESPADRKAPTAATRRVLERRAFLRREAVLGVGGKPPWPAEAWRSAFAAESRRLADDEAAARAAGRAPAALRRLTAYRVGRRFVAAWLRSEFAAAGTRPDVGASRTLTALLTPEPLPLPATGPATLAAVRALAGAVRRRIEAPAAESAR